jgi:biopolymer transport protein ExbD
MAYQPRAGRAVSDINVTPMVDVMLVLLIIFMVITPMLQKGFTVDMAKTQNPRPMADAEKEDAVLLAVSRDGKVYFGSDRIQQGEITSMVKDRIATRLDKTVYVRSDARAKYGDVVAVVNSVQAAGVDTLGLITERIERRGGPAPTAVP